MKTQPAQSWPIVELRRYTLHPGQRDVLIDLFEREFIESQELVGMQVMAHFRDLDAADRFVWFRGFHDMSSRAPSLQAFYFGPVWQQHRAAANATMIDSDNVLLLHEARAGSGFAATTQARPVVGSTAQSPMLVVACVYSLSTAADQAFLAWFEQELVPTATEAGATLLASYVSEHGANDFPQLPVREAENAFVWVAAFANASAYDAYRATLDASPRWRDRVLVPLSQRLIKPVETHRLAPAARSLVRG